MTFEEWLLTRTDISAAREAIHQNPAGALAPVPAPPEPTPRGLHEPPILQDSHEVSMVEARRVLLRRRGSTVGRRTILKSYTIPGLIQDTNILPELLVDGISDIRCTVDQPVFTIGNATVAGLRKLIKKLGATPGGNAHVVVTDLREELVLYVKGTAYMRRELEMPAAALHHAGIQAVKIEDLERRLRSDMIAESINWGGKVLLHNEVQKEGAVVRLFANGDDAADRSDGSTRSDLKKYDSFRGENRSNSSIEDITRTTTYQPSTHISAFWEHTGDVGDIDSVRHAC